MTYEDILKAFPASPLLNIEGLPFPHIASGKVREIYDIGDRLLIIATDRMSAFDVILPNGIPGKGMLLTQLSLWWFSRNASLIQNHLVPEHDQALANLLKDRPELISRSMLVRKLTPLPIEAVVRGYLAGSGWKVYQETGHLFEHKLPAGLRESDKLPEPLFTPTTKAQTGHDEPISEADSAALIGESVYAQVREASMTLFAQGTKQAQQAGLLLADTKFEFGLDENDTVYLIDEVLTPDSSRYWPADAYSPGETQEAFDKQYVRDYLETLDWDKTPPGPELPSQVVENTRKRYLKAIQYFMQT